MPLLHPPCPLCGGTDLTVISSLDQYRNAKPDAGESPSGILYVFKCQCGLTFQHIAKNDRSKVSASSHLANLDRLAVRGHHFFRFAAGFFLVIFATAFFDDFTIFFVVDAAVRFTFRAEVPTDLGIRFAISFAFAPAAPPTTVPTAAPIGPINDPAAAPAAAPPIMPA